MLRDVNPEKLGKYLILYHDYPCNLISMKRMGTFIGVLPVPLPFALNPSSYGEGRCTPPHVVFRPLLNKQSKKFCDFTLLYVADDPMKKKKIKDLVLILSEHFWDIY